jgi:hypothetical protein
MRVILKLVILIFTLIPINSKAQIDVQKDTVVILKQGNFLGTDSILGLSEVTKGSYKRCLKQIISIDTLTGVTDTITLRHGTSTYYDENHSVRRIEHYLNNVLVGSIRCFDKRYRLNAEFWIVNDIIVYTSYYKKGRIIASYDTNGENDSKTIVHYRKSGKMYRIERFKDGEKISMMYFRRPGKLGASSFEDFSQLNFYYSGWDMIAN